MAKLSELGTLLDIKDDDIFYIVDSVGEVSKQVSGVTLKDWLQVGVVLSEQVQADWNTDVPTSISFIKNKPLIPSVTPRIEVVPTITGLSRPLNSVVYAIDTKQLYQRSLLPAPNINLTTFYVTTRRYLATFNLMDSVITKSGNATNFGVSEIGAFGTTYSAEDNTYYMVGSSTDFLYTLDVTTGLATRVSGIYRFGVNEATPIGLVDFNNILYIIGRNTNALYTLDKTTGRATRVGTATNFGRGLTKIINLAVDPVGGSLLLVDQNTSRIYPLDATTGVARAPYGFIIPSAPPTLITVNDRVYAIGVNGSNFHLLNRDISGIETTYPLTGSVASGVSGLSTSTNTHIQPSWESV